MRICPSCNKNLGGYDYYFCSSCGNVLPQSLVNHAHEQPRTATLNDDFKPLYHFGVSLKHALKIINPLYISILALIAFMIGFCFKYVYQNEQFVIAQVVQQILGKL